MGIGFSVLLLAAGAILAFAVHATTIGGVDVHVVGYILMAAGVLGLLWSIALVRAGRREVVVAPQHLVTGTVVDPTARVVDPNVAVVRDVPVREVPTRDVP
jgi:hypothetical protein